MAKETRARSFAKTIAYRVVAIVLLAAVTYAFTGNLGETTLVTVVFNAGGAAAYYGLERFWDGIDWGRKPDGAGVNANAAFQKYVPDVPVRQGQEQSEE
jgi:uncharacterized membrane protein